jgi:uncharacterized cupredoxin-like copper-binding protein
VVLAALFVVAGCAQPTSPAGTNDGGVAIAPSAPPANSPVDVALVDSNGANGPMSLVPFVDSAPAGDVTFRVKNLGTIEHEMIVLKTDTPFDQLPVADGGDPPAPVTTGADKVDEGASVGETGDPNLQPGETRTFTITGMTPGKYVLVCNLAGHYQMGMRAPFTVTPAAANGGSASGSSAESSGPPGTVHATLSDTQGVQGPMTITTDTSTAPAGDVTFVVKNAGTIEHEMIVLKTDTPFDQLPVADAGDPPAPVTTGADKVDEGASVGETGDPNLQPGETRTFTITGMTAGKYVLVCNLAGHYQMGMRAPFTVS